MNDDYLWDRSGDPDPEVERLERVLGEYRYRDMPISPAMRSHFTWHRKPWVRFTAAAAAAIVIVVGGFFVVELQNNTATNVPELRASEKLPEPPLSEPQKEAKAPQVAEPLSALANGRKPVRNRHHAPSERKPAEEPSAVDSAFIAERQPIINPFIDAETAHHIERAQLLLRSFRNSSYSGPKVDANLSYEKQGSRELLYKNILLRRDAEAKGNLPVEELLGSLEPFLLDIANLPDRPSSNDLRYIKERMQKKEIVSALQIYSAPALSQVF
jgi:hypothetical protein